MRIVFFGTPELAVPSLQALSAHFDVTALVCQPDRPKGRGKKLQAPATKVWALEHDLEIQQPTKLNDGTFEEWLKEQAPDLCALVAYGRILKQPILDVPRLGFINMHPSRLPELRGPSPIQTSILRGYTETAITIMRLDAGMDTGDMLIQEPVPIEPEDTSESLSERLAPLGGELMVEAARQLDSGEAVFAPQAHDRATMTGMYAKADGRVRWNDSAESIRNLVRAAIPWPIAFCTLGHKPVRIHAVRVVEYAGEDEPGVIVEVSKDRVVVVTGEGALSIETLQNAGKRALPIADYLRGNPLRVGDRFEDA